MFIDIHTHAYRIKPMYGFCTAERLLERNNQIGIEIAVLLPVVNPEVYFPQSVEDILLWPSGVCFSAGMEIK